MFRRTAEKIICRNDLSRSKWQFCCAPYCVNATQTVETVTKKTHVGEIQVPKKKKRDPFQVLSALSSVVGQDPTRVMRPLEDEMYLKPHFRTQVEQFISAKGSGRKAAKKLINLRPDLFETPIINTAETPSIKAFTPKKFWFKNNKPSEEALLERIHSREYKEVVNMYSMIRSTDIALSQETLLLLLDFVAFYEGKQDLVNSKNIEPEENFIYHPKSFQYQGLFPQLRPDNITTKVFDSLPEKTPEAYNSMLRMLLEHRESPQLQAIHSEMKSLNIPYERLTYHLLLKRVSELSRESKLSGRVVDVLKQMSKAGIEPTEETFNCAIQGCLRPINKVRGNDVELVLAIIDEMKMYGIEPTMKTWFLLGRVIQFYPIFRSHRNLQHKIIDYMQGKEYSIYFESNENVFTQVISTAHRLKDVSLAMKTLKLLNHERNRLNLTRFPQIYFFYTNFLLLMIETQSVETSLEWIYKIVPSRLECLTSRMVQDLFVAIGDQEAYQSIPQVLKVSNSVVLLPIASTVLSVMNEKEQEPELQNSFAEFAAEIVQKWITFRESSSSDRLRQHNIIMTSDDVCNIMSLFHKVDQKEESWNFFQAVEAHRTAIQGIFSEEPFLVLLDDNIEKEMTENVVQLFNFMSLEGFSSIADAAKKVLSKVTLSDMERKQIEVLAASSKPKVLKKKNKPDRPQKKSLSQ